MKQAVYTSINGKKTFLGKHIDDVIYREFPFKTAVLWQDKELSFDKRLLDYAIRTKVKGFVFTDPVKRISLKVGIKALQNNVHERDEHGRSKLMGAQYYFSKSLGEKLIKVKKTPYVKQEVMI